MINLLIGICVMFDSVCDVYLVVCWMKYRDLLRLSVIISGVVKYGVGYKILYFFY